MATAPYPIASTADGRVKYSDGSIRGNQSTTSGYAANIGVPGTTMNSQNYQVPTGSTSGGGTPSSTRTSSPEPYNPYTAPPPSGYGSYQQYVEEMKAREEAIRNNIKSGFGNIYSELDKMAGLVPGQQAEDTALLGDTVGKLTSGVQSGMQSSLDKLGSYRTDIKNQTSQATSQIAQQLRNLLTAGQRQLGSLGAGSSSAAGELQKMLGGQASRAGVQIYSQAQGQFSELDRKAIDVKQFSEDSLTKIGTWQNEQEQAIRNQARQQLNQISQLKMQAQGNELTALNALETQLLGAAQNQLSQIQQQATQWQQGIQQWSLQRIADLQNMQIQQGQLSNYNPTQLTYQALQGAGMGGSAPVGDSFQFNPTAQRKPEETSPF